MTDPVPSKDQIVDELRAVCRLLPLEIAGRAADEIERLQREIARITGEREGPHCSTCGCGLAHEPAAAQLPIPADWDLASRLNVVYNRLFLDCRLCEQEEAEILYAAIGALRAAQPPRAE